MKNKGGMNIVKNGGRCTFCMDRLSAIAHEQLFGRFGRSQLALCTPCHKVMCVDLTLFSENHRLELIRKNLARNSPPPQISKVDRSNFGDRND